MRKREYAIKIISKIHKEMPKFKIRTYYKRLEKNDNHVKEWGKEPFVSPYKEDSPTMCTGEVVQVIMAKFDNDLKANRGEKHDKYTY